MADLNEKIQSSRLIKIQIRYRLFQKSQKNQQTKFEVIIRQSYKENRTSVKNIFVRLIKTLVLFFMFSKAGKHSTLQQIIRKSYQEKQIIEKLYISMRNLLTFSLSISIIDYCLNILLMNDCDSFLTSISDLQSNPQSAQVKFISSKKWQKFMIDHLRVMIQKHTQKKNIITDLITIVSSIPQASFVQATLRIRPFKPQFLEVLPIFTNTTQQTMAETLAKNVRFENTSKKLHQETKKRHKITEKTLTQQFDKDYHPFKFIIKNFKRLLQLKFKSLIDSKKIKKFEDLIAQLKSDMAIFTEFLHKGSQPYKKLFKSVSSVKQSQNSIIENNKFQEFLDSFITDNDRLNKCIHKIIVYCSRAFYKNRIEQKIKDYPVPEDFILNEQFRIDGCYIRSINSLMQFSEGYNHQKSMKKLFQIRQNILIDISEFYLDRHKQNKQLEVSAQVQIQIIRFSLAKLKGWACQIYAQLKYLQYMYGQQQMGYKYEQSSYMYTQLSMAFQILDMDNQLQNS